MIKQILFASAGLTVAIGATFAATSPAYAQTGEASATVQLSGAMRSVSMSEAMASAETRAEFGLADRPVHTVVPGNAASDMTASASPSVRLSMLNGFSIAEEELAAIMIGDRVDIVRPRPMAGFTGQVGDDHDFGNIGFSEVDAFHTDPSPSQIGIRFSF
ncbi:hypothetical protein HFP51_14230 [Parasphingopyxis sp. CP4]|uniref:hypothetical protein n=1 Tax=Parasphingopyxis sp. CP4 TaxID=2724527 RepID=UPI0015A2A643|nr:hypothetical protein [Parasphingopyxis sp. CP4]QLC23242.1 hypothetical protein HFP51_14230 [Parasphingopyxis sp. CP4]